MLKLLKKEIRPVHAQVTAFVIASVAHFGVSQQNAAALTSDIHEAHHQFNEIDLPKIKSKYEAEIVKLSDIQKQMERELHKSKHDSCKTSRQVRKLEEQLNQTKTKLSILETSKIDEADEEQIRQLRRQVSALSQELQENQKRFEEFSSFSQQNTAPDSSHQSALLLN